VRYVRVARVGKCLGKAGVRVGVGVCVCVCVCVWRGVGKCLGKGGQG